MRVQNVADGTVTGTRVLSEDGRDISSAINAVRFSHKGGDLPRAEIDIICATGTALANATLFHAVPGQERKAIRRIEYVDGTVFQPNADEPLSRESDDGA